MLLLLACSPWIMVGFYMAGWIRMPRDLPPAPPMRGAGGARPPRVSIIVPARNEERSIGSCVESLTKQEYPDFEVLVVDDRSEDRTAAIVRSLPLGNASRVTIVEGTPLPDGWFGKPWACQQGGEAATGELLLFTDADTIHAPDLLPRVVAALEEDRADALSLVGRQILGTFWERVIQPQIFGLIGMRFPRLDRVMGGGRWRDAVANGQYMILTRRSWEELGGHGSVRHEVVEDVRMAQELVRRGNRLTIRRAEEAFATRMYQSLSELVNGWTKNVATGTRQTALPGVGSVAVPALLSLILILWVVPPVVLLAGATGVIPGSDWLPWAGFATLSGVLIWSGASWRMGVFPLYGVFYPLGAAMTAFILLRSWVRGSRRIEWKGRRYST